MAKFRGENTKVTAAKEKKAAAKAEKESKERAVKEAKEDLEWQKGAKKPGKTEEKEAKKAKDAARKAELALLKKQEEEEMAKIKPKKPLKGEDKKAAKKESKIDNFISTSSSGKETVELQARNIDDALDLFSTIEDSKSSSQTKAGGLDAHPERRAKAAYNAFEARRLPELKEENKGLRLTQLKQLLWKEWQKSPENPFNQAHVAYNTKMSEKRDIVEQTRVEIEERLKI